VEYIKLQLQKYGNYRCIFFSNEELGNLAFLFTSDLGCPGTSLDDWIFDDNRGMETGGNLIYLEKEGNYILLSDLYDEDKNNPVKLKISRQQLAQLIYDWQEKVCKLKPQEVTITYENDTFSLTISN